jgi:hypothetical protein
MPTLHRAVNHLWRQPLRWYRPHKYSAGTWVDSGHTPKNLTGSASTSNSAAGLQIDFNGTSHSLAGASAADWSFLHQVGYWTVGAVVSAGSLVLTTYAGTNSGFYCNILSSSADFGQFNNNSLVHRIGCTGHGYTTAPCVVIMRSASVRTANTGGTASDQGGLYLSGQPIAKRTNGVGSNTNTNNIALKVGRNSTDSGYNTMSLLDLFFDNREWGEDEILSYSAYWQWRLDQI